MDPISAAQLQSRSGLTSLDRTGRLNETLDREKIKKTAEDFEAVLLTELLRPMLDTMQVDPMFGGGKGEEVFKDFLLQEYGKKFASTGGIGLARHVEEQLIRLQSGEMGEIPASKYERQTPPGTEPLTLPPQKTSEPVSLDIKDLL